MNMLIGELIIVCLILLGGRLSHNTAIIYLKCCSAIEKVCDAPSLTQLSTLSPQLLFIHCLDVVFFR